MGRFSRIMEREGGPAAAAPVETPAQGLPDEAASRVILRPYDAAMPKKYLLPPAFGVELQKLKETLLEESAKLRKGILFSSVIPREGNTAILSSLGISLACQGDTSVLLVDANMRSPRLHDVFEVPDSPGLTDVLQGKIDAARCVVETAVPNLYVLPVGNGNGNALEGLFSQERFHSVFDALHGRYQALLVDSSPVLHFADFKALAPHLGGAVVLFEMDKARWEEIQKARQAVEEAGLAFLGYVMNKKRRYIPRFLLREE